MTDGSLRAQLLRWLLVPLGLLWAADAASTWFSALATVNAAYDRALYASALSIAERVTVRDGVPSVDIPAAALEVLDTAEQERIFYRVSYRVGDGPEALLTGYGDLPTHRCSERPSSYDDRFHGYPIRVAALTRRFPTAPPIAVYVQVAETIVGRGRLHRGLVTRELAVALGVIVLAVALGWVAVTRGLRPVSELSREMAHRSATDLSPVTPERVPRELAPAIQGVNDLMSRLRRTLAAQRRFVADASHALRTPLTVLRTQADVALREEDPRALRDAIAQLRDQSRSAGHLASQLLALARLGPHAEDRGGEIVDLDLDALAREACAALVPAALERGVDLGYEGSGPAPVRGRAHELREAIWNLVDNALRYGRSGGTVTVSVTGAGPARSCLAVEDDGPGIAPEHRGRVLEPFHRLPGSPGDGAGLGLAIVKEIAEGHGAALRLGDGPGGRGLRVELHLPANAGS